MDCPIFHVPINGVENLGSGEYHSGKEGVCCEAGGNVGRIEGSCFPVFCYYTAKVSSVKRKMDFLTFKVKCELSRVALTGPLRQSPPARDAAGVKL